MNFGQIYTEAWQNFGSQDVSRVKIWANWAQHEINMMRDWSWRETSVTFATVANQTDYVIAGTSPVITDYDGYISAQHNIAAGSLIYLPVKLMAQDEFDKELAPWSGSGPVPPKYCTMRGTTPAAGPTTVVAGGQQLLSFWPAFNFIGSCKFRYWRSLDSAEMVNDTDIPIIPARYHKAIVLLTLKHGLMAEDQMIQAQVAAGQAQEILQGAVRADMALRGDDTRDKVTFPAKMPPSGAIADPSRAPYRWDVEG